MLGPEWVAASAAAATAPMISCLRKCLTRKITGISAHEPQMRRRVTYAAFIRKSVLQILRAERMRPHTTQIEIWKASSRPVPRCRLDVDASESLPKSAVSSARFLPTKRNQLHESKNMEYHKRPTNARNVSFRVPKMARLPIHWPACPLMQPLRKPSARLHVRADLLAWRFSLHCASARTVVMDNKLFSKTTHF